MAWQSVTTADGGKWQISRRIFSDPSRHAVIQRVTFETLEPGKSIKDYHVYLLNTPAINNSGAGSDGQCGSRAAAFYLQKADEWRNNVANWTFTTAGLTATANTIFASTPIRIPTMMSSCSFKIRHSLVECVGRM